MLPTMYSLVHFKLSLENTQTYLNCVKIPIFAVAATLKVWIFHLICRYKHKKMALLSLLLSSKIPSFALLL